jgi:hypothetical protein
MAQRGALDGRDSLSNPPSLVRVTVESQPRGRPPVGRALRLRAFAVVSLVVASAVAAGVLVVPGGGGTRRHRTAPPRSVAANIAQGGPRLRGAAQVAAVTEAYRFPLGCMGMTLTDRALADAVASRTGPCWRYGVFVTAVLWRTGNTWQLALEATSRSCPRVALPPNIRAELAVCRR